LSMLNYILSQILVEFYQVIMYHTVDPGSRNQRRTHNL
jgi:hypothetical protein